MRRSVRGYGHRDVAVLARCSVLIVVARDQSQEPVTVHHLRRAGGRPIKAISRVSLEIVPVGHPGMTDVRSASPEMRSTPGMAVDGTPNKGRAIRSGTPITIGRAPIVRGRLSVVPEPD
jgi:hypothetical protein